MADQDQFDQMKFNALVVEALEIMARNQKLQKAEKITQDEQIAELQTDRTTILEAVSELQAHKETVSGDGGLTSQMGDPSVLPALRDRILAAVPELMEPATGTDAPAAAPAQDPAPQAAAA